MHGSTHAAESLRHTFSTINKPFTADIDAGLQRLGFGTVVALGYEGADFDVLEPLARGTGLVHWLPHPDREMPAGAAVLGRTREVRIAKGDFASLLTLLGHPYDGDGAYPTFLEEPTRLELNALDRSASILAYDPVSYRAAVADRRARPADRRFLVLLQPVRDVIGDAAYWRLRAARAQARGEPVFTSPLAGAFLFWRAARASPDEDDATRRLSDAADSGERFGIVLTSLISRFTLPLHERAQMITAGNAGAIYGFRRARCMAAMRRHRDADLLLTEVLETGAHDMYMESQLRRRRAIARAFIGDPRWREDLRRAEDRIRFEGRSAELNDLLRAEAVCLIAAGGSRSAAGRLLLRSLRGHWQERQWAGVVRSTIMLLSLPIPRISRFIAR